MTEKLKKHKYRHLCHLRSPFIPVLCAGRGQGHHKGGGQDRPGLYIMNVCCFSFMIWCFFCCTLMYSFLHWMEMICCNLGFKFIFVYCTHGQLKVTFCDMNNPPPRLNTLSLTILFFQKFFFISSLTEYRHVHVFPRPALCFPRYQHKPKTCHLIVCKWRPPRPLPRLKAQHPCPRAARSHPSPLFICREVAL